MSDFYTTHTTDIPVFDRRLQLAAALVREAKPTSVLDLGCGRGVLLRNLRELLPSSTLAGADISLANVEQVRTQGFEAKVADISTALPFESETFDCVVFGEIIEHLVDPDAALQEISRILRRGGTLIVTTPNLASWFNRLLLLAGIQPIATETSLHVNLGRKLRFLGQWRPTQGHLKLFTRSALEEILSANGYEVGRVLGAPFAEHNPVESFDRLVARVPSLASNFVVSALNLRTLQTFYNHAGGWH